MSTSDPVGIARGYVEDRPLGRCRHEATPSVETADMIDSTLQKEPIERKDAKEPIEPTEKAELIEPMLMKEFFAPMLNAESLDAMLHRELLAISASVMPLLHSAWHAIILSYNLAIEVGT